MKKLIAIGEALIDFIPSEKGKAIKAVPAFYANVGGAPANVCGAFSKLGGESEFITQLGKDPFGDKIIDEFKKYGIGSNYILRTDKANTSLAFVALKEDGNREFSFYRNPGADMLLEAKDIKEEWFTDSHILHFCSVSLGDFPMKDAHRKAIEYALKNNMLISFDPNLRLQLWKDIYALRETVLEFMPRAHIVKISDEELEFITGRKTIEEAKDILFKGNTKIVVYTKGPKGSEVWRENDHAKVDAIDVEVADTTGAGDGFIGAFLYKATELGITVENMEKVSLDILSQALDFADMFSTISVTKRGAIASYPDKFKLKADSYR